MIDLKTRLIMAVLVLMAGLLVLASQCTNDNVRPVALFTVDRVDGPSPLTVNFDGSGSYDPDGTIEYYSWNFGDGTSGTGVATSHTFITTTDKTYTVRLTVTDDGGKSATTSTTISVTVLESGTTLFFDDFEDGVDPAWASTSTSWKVRNGTYVFDTNAYLPKDIGFAFVVSGKDWADYQVEADVWLPDYGGHTVGIIIHAQQNLSSMLLVWGNPHSIHWEVIENGETLLSSQPISPGLFVERWQHVVVTRDGSEYSLYVDGLLRSIFGFSPFEKGMPGIAASGSASVLAPLITIDNFRVTSLP